MKPDNTLNIIVAVDNKSAIGRRGDLIYKISADLRRFKELTTGHAVIMGRKTWESLPKGALPGRRNMVISRNADYRAAGAEVFTSLDAAVSALSPGQRAFIIGGASIYKEALPLADNLYLTEIDAVADDADTFFPEFDRTLWDVTDDSDTGWRADDKTGLRFRFVCLSRK